MADRDGGTGSVTVVVRLTMVVRASLTNFCQKHIAVLSARADPKRLSTGTSVLCKPLSCRVLLSPQLGNDPGIGVNRSRKLRRGINAVKVWGTNFSSSQSNMTEAVRAIGVTI
jgi:hypothetical protein